MFQSCCFSNPCLSFRSLFTCRAHPRNDILATSFQKNTKSENDSIIYGNDNLRAKLEEIGDNVGFLKAIISFENNEPIRNILRFEKLLDHDLFVERMSSIPDEDIKNDKVLPNKYYQDSFIYLKLKAELISKQNSAKRNSFSGGLKNYDYISSLLIFQSTLNLLRKTLDIFSFSFYTIKKNIVDRVVEKRINVYKKLFFMALKEFTIFICRIDFIKEEKYLQELEESANQFFQISDRFLITMSNLKITDEEIESISEFHKKNLKALVSLSKSFCAFAQKKADNKKYQTLDLIRIRFQEALAEKQFKIAFLEEEVDTLSKRIDSYKARGLFTLEEPKKSRKHRALSVIKESNNDEIKETEDVSDEEPNFKQSGELSTIKELSSNYDNASSTTEGMKKSGHVGTGEEMPGRFKEKHLSRTSFILSKKNKFD